MYWLIVWHSNIKSTPARRKNSTRLTDNYLILINIFKMSHCEASNVAVKKRLLFRKNHKQIQSFQLCVRFTLLIRVRVA